jgi:hypothetical protein
MKYGNGVYHMAVSIYNGQLKLEFWTISIVPVFIFTNSQRFGDWLRLRLQVKKTRKRGGLVYMNTRIGKVKSKKGG